MNGYKSFEMKLFTIFIVLVFVCVGSAQESIAVKFADVDNSKEATSVFVQKMEAFVEKILKGPINTFGVITIAGENSAITQERARLAKKRVRRDAEVKRRISILEYGRIYDKSWSQSEFWMIPEGAKPPYIPFTADYSCPTIEISGTELLEDDKDVVYFTANVSGSPVDITYHWTITGGKIVSGKDTPAIKVKIDRLHTKEVTAKLEIKDEVGDLEEAYCITKAAFTTKVLSR